MRSSFLQRLEAASLSRLSRHRSLHDLVDSDSDARETSPGSAGVVQSIGARVSRSTTLERPKDVHRSTLSRPEPLAEVAEAPFSHKVRGSPSELSTATTAPGEDGNELQGEAVQRLTSPVGSSGLASDLGDSGCGVWQREDPVVTMARLKGQKQSATKKLVSELELPVKVLSNGRIDRHALHQAKASTQELEQSLSTVTSQARRLWRRVEDSEQLVNELQARLHAATGSQSHAGTCQAPDPAVKAAQEEERKLRERVAFLEKNQHRSGLGDTRRKSARLRAKIARLEQERQEVSEEAAFYRNSCRQVEAEVQSLKSKVRLREEEHKRNKEMEARLKSLLQSLLPKSVAEESLLDLANLARLVGRTWAESRNLGEARRAEMISLKEHRQKLENFILDTQANIESETQRLLRAEEDLARLESERRAHERLVKEELAVARAENKLLNEDRSLWLQTRPRLLNLIEDLNRPAVAAPSVFSRPEVDEALQAAEKENQELQQMLQQLERDKAAIIQEQEDMIQRVRERVAPLQDRVLARQS